MRVPFKSYVIDDDIESIDFSRVTVWLATTYWSPRISQREVEQGARHSTLVIGVYEAEGLQVGYARVVSDKTRFAYTLDVFVEPAHRGEGKPGASVRFAMDHPEYQDVYQWVLSTQDAHAVYERVGFRPLDHPERWMILRKEKVR